MNVGLTILERRSLTSIIEGEVALDPVVTELATKAHEVLGYSALLNEVNRAKTVQAPVNLMKALIDLETEPFSDESVVVYKDQKLVEKNGSPMKPSVWIGGWLMLSVFVFCIVFAIVHSQGVSMSLKVALGIATFATVISALAGYCERGERWQWRSFLLAQYHNQVPVHVLNKAIAIQERVPEAKFFVDELTNGDPLLRVECGKSKFYIEVWGEPKFEA